MHEYDDEPYVTLSGDPVEFIKSSSGNKIGGRVITYSSQDAPDRVKDFFDAASDTWLNGAGDRKPILYRHGLDKSIRKRRFGEVQLMKSADGIYASGYISGSDPVSQTFLDLARAGELNWSTGSVGHLVEKSPTKSGAMHVDSWPIAECSLCPHDYVCEPRNIVSLKSLIMSDVPDFDALFGKQMRVEDDRTKAATKRAEQIYQDLMRIEAGEAQRQAAQLHADFIKSQTDRIYRETLQRQAEIEYMKLEQICAR